MPPTLPTTALGGLLCFMTNAEQVPASLWKTAEQKCWRHVEIATAMMRLMTQLGELQVISVIPILSDTSPTLMITPECAGDLLSVKAICRLIAANLGVPNDWKQVAINDEWMLRLDIEGGVQVNVMTRLPATKESPIEL